jgi:hypothetical protein
VSFVEKFRSSGGLSTEEKTAAVLDCGRFLSEELQRFALHCHSIDGLMASYSLLRQDESAENIDSGVLRSLRLISDAAAGYLSLYLISLALPPTLLPSPLLSSFSLALSLPLPLPLSHTHSHTHTLSAFPVQVQVDAIAAAISNLQDTFKSYQRPFEALEVPFCSSLTAMALILSCPFL